MAIVNHVVLGLDQSPFLFHGLHDPRLETHHDHGRGQDDLRVLDDHHGRCAGRSQSYHSVPCLPDGGIPRLLSKAGSDVSTLTMNEVQPSIPVPAAIQASLLLEALAGLPLDFPAHSA